MWSAFSRLFVKNPAQTSTTDNNDNDDDIQESMEKQTKNMDSMDEKQVTKNLYIKLTYVLIYVTQSIKTLTLL